MTKRKTIELSEPDWNAQLRGMGMSDKSIKDMTFRPGDHDFFIAMNDVFQDALTKEMKILVHDVLVKSNKSVCTNVSKMLVSHTKEVGDTYAEMMKAMERIANDINDISTDIRLIKDDISSIKDRLTIIEGKVASDQIRIENLENMARNDHARYDRDIRELQIILGIKRPWYLRPLWVAVSKIVEIATIISVLTYLHNKYL
jgi:hypothetical protein